MSYKNIYLTASRKKLRFPSNKGELTVEQLWDVPLSSKTGFDLDTIAKTCDAAVKRNSEGSFVRSYSAPSKDPLANLRMDIILDIIDVKLQEQQAAAVKAEREAMKQKLVGALARAEEKELDAKTPDQIRAELARL